MGQERTDLELSEPDVVKSIDTSTAVKRKDKKRRSSKTGVEVDTEEKVHHKKSLENTIIDEKSPKKDEKPKKKDENPPKKDENPPKNDENPPKKDEKPPKKDEKPQKKDKKPLKGDEKLSEKDETLPKIDRKTSK